VKTVIIVGLKRDLMCFLFPLSLSLIVVRTGKEKVAKVIPNAILITTESEKFFLTSFTSRDKTHLMLFRVWQNALMDKPMNPQELWQWVIMHGFINS
jgi:hypothetical protein